MAQRSQFPPRPLLLFLTLRALQPWSAAAPLPGAGVLDTAPLGFAFLLDRMAEASPRAHTAPPPSPVYFKVKR